MLYGYLGQDIITTNQGDYPLKGKVDIGIYNKGTVPATFGVHDILPGEGYTIPGGLLNESIAITFAQGEVAQVSSGGEKLLYITYKNEAMTPEAYLQNNPECN